MQDLPGKRTCDICKVTYSDDEVKEMSTYTKDGLEAFYFDDNFSVCESHWHGVVNFIGSRKKAKKPISVSAAVKMLVSLIKS